MTLGRLVLAETQPKPGERALDPVGKVGIVGQALSLLLRIFTSELTAFEAGEREPGFVS